MPVLASDAYTRADNADLGSNWTPISDNVSGGDNFTVATNDAKAANPTAADACEGYTGVTWPNDQWAESTLGGVTSSGLGAGAGAAVRTVAGSSSTFDCYRAIANGNGWEVGEWVDGVYASLGSASSTTFANADRIYLEAQGSTLVAKKNSTNGVGGTVLTTVSSETSIPAGNAGIAHSTVDNGATITDWAGGDFAAADVVLRDPRAPKMGFRNSRGLQDAGPMNFF